MKGQLKVPYEKTRELELKFILYSLKEILRHLGMRLTLAAFLVAMVKKDSPVVYRVELIRQKERTVLVSSAIVGIGFGSLAAALVIAIKGDENMMVMVAGILISVGLAQQIMSLGLDAITLNMSNYISSWNTVLNLLAKQHTGPQWEQMKETTREIFIFPHILYSLPPELDNHKYSKEKMFEYLDHHKWEVDYHQAKLYNDEKSLHSFAKYAAEYLRDRLLVYDRLTTAQQRTGGINPVIFVALGTLIWLLS